MTRFTQQVTLTAQELTGEHIGAPIRFLLVNPKNKVEWIVTGDLKEVAHGVDVVRIGVGSKFSNEILSERLGVDQRVIINPSINTVEDISEMRK